MPKQLLVEKYRPSTVDEYIFQDSNQSKAINKMIADQSIPHLLLSGVQGTGKTTLAFILTKALNIDETDLMVVNASDENSVDVMRDKIKNFVTTFAMGDFKVVVMEEADYITPAGQGVLRRMMEEYADFARFIFTCNYEHRIIPAIKSRSQQFKFKSFDKDDIAERLVRILATEKTKFTLELVDKYVAVGYPDIRKIINTVEQNTVDGVLLPPTSESEAGDYKFVALELMEMDKWDELKATLCGTVPDEEWVDVFRFLYENLQKSPTFSNSHAKWEEGIVTIVKFMNDHISSPDPEMNAAALLISLKHLTQ